MSAEPEFFLLAFIMIVLTEIIKYKWSYKMQKLKIMFSSAALIMFIFGLYGCDRTNPVESGSQSLNSALQKITANDPAVQSFEPNYNEAAVMNIVGGLAKEIYPVRIGQNLKMVDSQLDFQQQADTAYGYLTQKFEGELLIAASYQKSTTGNPSRVDTLIRKPYSTVVTRVIKYAKVGDTGNQLNDWRVIAVSLASGGSNTTNIDIKKITVTFADGKVYETTSPNDFFLTMVQGAHHQFPLYVKQSSATVRVELVSAYSDEDVLTLTHGMMIQGMANGYMMGGIGSGSMGNGMSGNGMMGGGMMNGGMNGNSSMGNGSNTNTFGNRNKLRFQLISSTQNGSSYNKVYELKWNAPSVGGGFMHAVVNAMPKQSVYDDTAPVEEKSWGIPIAVK